MPLSITKPPEQVWQVNYSSLAPFKPLAWEHPLLVLWLSLLLYSGDRPYFTGIGNVSDTLIRVLSDFRSRTAKLINALPNLSYSFLWIGLRNLSQIRSLFSDKRLFLTPCYPLKLE